MNINPFIDLIGIIIELYIWAIGIWIILSWLISFQIVNAYQPFVFKVMRVLSRLVEPPLQRIRRYMPDLIEIDLSPLVLLLGIWFFRSVLYTYFYVV